MSFNINSGYNLNMEDFNDSEQDWFFDVDEPLKSSELSNIGSPGVAIAESTLSDFTALNVPIDDGFFCNGSDSQCFNSNQLNEPVSSFQQSPAVQNDQQQLSNIQLLNQYENINSYTSNNLNNNSNVDNVTFHQSFQNNSVDHVLQQNHQQSAHKQSVITNSKFVYNSESNFVDCQPSTSTAQVVTTCNPISSHQTQNYKEYSSSSVVSADVMHSGQNQQWIQQINHTPHLNSQHLQPPSISTHFNVSQHQPSNHIQSIQTNNHGVQQYFQNSQQVCVQSNLPASATIVAVDNSIHQQNISSQQFNSDISYQIIQQNGIQQVAYVNQPQVSPFITGAQKITLPNTHIQTFSTNNSIHTTLNDNTQNYKMILQPQQTNLITQQSQASLISSSLEQQSIILPQNTHLINTSQQSQNYFTTLPLSTQNGENVALSSDAINGKKPRSTGRRQSKQGFLNSLSSGSGGDVSTLGAVVQKIYARTGDMNAAVRFTPEMTVEFSKMASKLNQLKEEQVNTGINLCEEIKAVEDRIVKILSVAEPTTQTPPKIEYNELKAPTSNNQSTIYRDQSLPIFSNHDQTILTNEIKTTRPKPKRSTNNNKSVLTQQTILSAPITQLHQKGVSYSVNGLQSDNIVSVQQTQFYNNNAPNIVIAAPQKIISNPPIQQQKMLPIQPAPQPTVYATSQQVNILNSVQQPIQISQSTTNQFLTSKQMSIGTSKKRRGLAAKYQELQKQYQQQQLKESQLPPPQTLATTVELHPLLVGHITPQQLAQIISTTNLNTNSPTTIIVDFNGQQLPIVVRTTLLSTNNTSIVDNSINNTNNLTNSHVQPTLIQNVNQNNIPVKEQNHYDQILNDVVTSSTNFQNNNNNTSSNYSKTVNSRQKRNSNNRPPSSASVNSFSASLTPTQSTSFDLDDTIESVCQQASLAAAASSRSNSAHSISVAAALSSRTQTKRKPRSKIITYNAPEVLPVKPIIQELKKPIPPPPPPLILPSPIELGKKIAEKKQERQNKLNNHFDKLRNDILSSSNYDDPFVNKEDCFNKLLPFAFAHEPDLSDSFIEKNHEQLRCSIDIREKQINLESQIRNILYKESTIEKIFESETFLLSNLELEYEYRKLDEAKKLNSLNSDALKELKSIETFQKERIVDFEYKEFDELKYLNISPYNSPFPLPSLSSSDDESSSEFETVSEQSDLEFLSSASEKSIEINENDKAKCHTFDEVGELQISNTIDNIQSSPLKETSYLTEDKSLLNFDPCATALNTKEEHALNAKEEQIESVTEIKTDRLNNQFNGIKLRIPKLLLLSPSPQDWDVFYNSKIDDDNTLENFRENTEEQSFENFRENTEEQSLENFRENTDEKSFDNTEIEQQQQQQQQQQKQNRKNKSKSEKRHKSRRKRQLENEIDVYNNVQYESEIIEDDKYFPRLKIRIINYNSENCMITNVSENSFNKFEQSENNCLDSNLYETITKNENLNENKIILKRRHRHSKTENNIKSNSKFLV